MKQPRRLATLLTAPLLVGAAAAATALPAQAGTGLDHDAQPGGAAFYTEQTLAMGPDGVFPNYRIPALTVAPSGDVLVGYDGRPTGIDAPGPNSILQRRSTDGGLTFGPQEAVHAGSTDPLHGYSDPSYIVDRQTGTIFNFHVASQKQGFSGSRAGTDPADPNVLHAEVSTSTDDGHTWTHRLITADITKSVDWRSRFAASGQGIQLRYGPYAGRLVQQFTIIDAGNVFRAVSVFSDDHGATWQAGEAVGVGMDENKVVELSDGRLMMNSRDSAGSKYRKVAYSSDGGQTWGEVTLDRTLIDPTNNASIIRAYPNAPEGSREAKILLFSNAASQSGRETGTIRMSCDDGKTWPIAKVFKEGPMAYSTLATLPDGAIGLAYEPGHNGIVFAKFNLAWLGGSCTPMTIPDVVTTSGKSFQVGIKIDNQAGRALPNSSLQLDLPEGWVLQRVQLPNIKNNRVTTAVATVFVPKGAPGGEYDIRAHLRTKQGESQKSFHVSLDMLDRTAMKIQGFDSEEPFDQSFAANAIDGDPATIWHTGWKAKPAPVYPHYLSVDLGGTRTVRAIHYTPRQNQANGRIGGYEIQTSLDGTTWTTATTGTFAEGAARQRVAFPEVAARYVKVVATSPLTAGQAWASIAELGVEGSRPVRS